MTTTVNWERAFEPLRTEPIVEDIPTELTYTVTLRKGGERPYLLDRHRGLDSIEALRTVVDLMPESRYRFFEELDLSRPFVAIHRHEIGADYGQITPVAFFQ